MSNYEQEHVEHIEYPEQECPKQEDVVFEVGDVVYMEPQLYRGKIHEGLENTVIKTVNGGVVQRVKVVEVVPAGVLPDLNQYPAFKYRKNKEKVRNTISYIVYDETLNKHYWPIKMLYKNPNEGGISKEQRQERNVKRQKANLKKDLVTGNLLNISARLTKEDGSELMERLIEEEGSMRQAIVSLLETYKIVESVRQREKRKQMVRKTSAKPPVKPKADG